MKKTVSLLLALVLAASLLPGAALAAGSYTAAMPMDQSASVGEETALRLVIGSAGSRDYAAAYLVLSYDAARLAFTGCGDASYSVNRRRRNRDARALRRFRRPRRGNAHVPAPCRR